MKIWERIRKDWIDFERGFARILKTLGEYAQGFDETLGEDSQGFARLWESIRKDSHWERIHEDLQGFARI